MKYRSPPENASEQVDYKDKFSREHNLVHPHNLHHHYILYIHFPRHFLHPDNRCRNNSLHLNLQNLDPASFRLHREGLQTANRYIKYELQCSNSLIQHIVDRSL